MNLSLAFTRLFFAALSVFFMIAYMISYPEGSVGTRALVGLGIGFAFSMLLFFFDTLFRRFSLRNFNIAVLGLFVGYLMGQALVLIFASLLEISAITFTIPEATKEIVNIALFLFGTYLGMIMALKSSNELYISIPFVRLSAANRKRRDVVLDSTILTDVRLVDLCSSNILNGQIILPRFILKDLYAQAESTDDLIRNKARKGIEVVKKLESMSRLELRINDNDFPEVKDINQKTLKLARLIDANVLTADLGKVQISTTEGIDFININDLANALKPLMQAGETIRIKVQRYGKEPKQGVGYLDDGTMVVINNGGDFIGEIIDSQVISVKQTSAGRIIFTNALVEAAAYDQEHEIHHESIYD